ncbi:MAG: hypothetical protein ACI9G1_001841 [Pirellulaceae bacterium]|jgi:hypothetical protein
MPSSIHNASQLNLETQATAGSQESDNNAAKPTGITPGIQAGLKCARQFVCHQWKPLAFTVALALVAAFIFTFTLNYKEYGSYSVVRVIPADLETQRESRLENELIGLSAIATSLDVAKGVIDETGIDCRPSDFQRLTQVKFQLERPEILEFKLRWRTPKLGAEIVETWVLKTIEVADSFDQQRLHRTEAKRHKQSQTLEEHSQQIFAEIAQLEQQLGGDAQLSVQRDEFVLRQFQEREQNLAEELMELANQVAEMERTYPWLSSREVLLPNHDALSELQLAAFQLQDLNLNDVRSSTPVNQLLEELDANKLAHSAKSLLDEELTEGMLQIAESKRQLASERYERNSERFSTLTNYIGLRESQFLVTRRRFAVEHDVANAAVRLSERLSTRRSMDQLEGELAAINSRRLKQQLKLDQLAVADSLADRIQVVVAAYELDYPIRSNRKKLLVLSFALFAMTGFAAVGVIHFTRTPQLPRLEIGDAHVIVERSEVYDRVQSDLEANSNTAT